MNAIVLGAGRSGEAAAALLAGDSFGVRVLNGNDAWPEDVEFGLCVASPGIPPEHQWFEEARRRGVPVLSELQLGVERLSSLGVKMLAVTGSKGKSSVVKLVANALGGVPCGNYGTPVCDVARRIADGEADFKWAVVEVSSFQMETTSVMPEMFEAAAILNLQEDHLDRHKTKETYHSLKLKLLECARIKIAGEGVECPEARSVRATDEAELVAGSYFGNPVLRSNGLCAVELMRTAGLADDAIREAFMGFEPLPHRMQTVCERGGVKWIDDSKATSLAALKAGVEMAAVRCGEGGKVHLIAGGLPKGDDPADVLDALSANVSRVYLIGQSAKAFATAWEKDVQCELCGTMEMAVESARSRARSGDCVLLSPGTASFDQFKSYGERGDRFAALARVV